MRFCAGSGGKHCFFRCKTLLSLQENIAFSVAEHSIFFSSAMDVAFRIGVGMRLAGGGKVFLGREALINGKDRLRVEPVLSFAQLKIYAVSFQTLIPQVTEVRENYTKSFSSRCSFWRVKKMRLFTVPRGRSSFSAISRYLNPATCMENGTRYSLGSALTMRCISFRS